MCQAFANIFEQTRLFQDTPHCPGGASEVVLSIIRLSLSALPQVVFTPRILTEGTTVLLIWLCRAVKDFKSVGVVYGLQIVTS